MNENRKELIKTLLLSFKIPTYDLEEIRGATVTLYKFRPQIGVRVSKIRNLKDELAIALCVPSVRIIAPMEDGAVGIEVPNKDREILQVSDLLNTWEYQNTAMQLPLAIGRTITNKIFMADLAEMPHLLVAGATGQGKSVCLNVMLMSLLNKKTPDELQLVLIDPKKVEFSLYSKIESSYLASPVITVSEEAEQKLEDICDIMDERYELLSSVSVRNIQEYNAISIVEKLPYLVIVIDEYGDLVMTSGKQMERYICRIAQKARAVGIHMIISTQRPSGTIITGNIKANFPARIAFRTTTGMESRVILDQAGAEKLTGKGDMLFFAGAETTRVQCAYTSISDVTQLCDVISKKYVDYQSMPIPKQQETKVILSKPIFPDMKEMAMIIAEYDNVTESSFIWLMSTRLNKILYDWEAYDIYKQMCELGIIGNGGWGNSNHVLIHDKAQISRLIDKFS